MQTKNCQNGRGAVSRGDDALQQEFDFMRAELFTRRLLAQGLISRDEFRLIMRENRKTFPTFLSSIL